MPVSYLPCITPLLLIGVPILLLFKSRRAAAIAAVQSIVILSTILLSIYVPGWRLHSQAAAGNPYAQYRYAQWIELHSGELNDIILWPPSEPDVYGGLPWLEKAAAQDYPPAVWLLGARFKYGMFVPEPTNWKGPGGNVFPQPERGQPMIDHAVNDLGYVPPSDAWSYFYQHYGHNLPP
jgi:hypothetical protein